MRNLCSLLCPDAAGVGWGIQQPREGRPPKPAERGEILTDSFQVVSGPHLGRAHLHKGIADLVQHLSKRRVRSEGKGSTWDCWERVKAETIFLPQGPRERV